MAVSLSHFAAPMHMRCRVQHYAWGRRGGDSIIARLSGELASDRPFAELWMGAHPSAPAEVSVSGEFCALTEVIENHPQEILGDRVFQEFGPTLPFLFKLLSINTALSIQAHPDKTLARVLHQHDPKNYPDQNHKPEMAIALSPVSLLYGFRPWSEIRDCLRVVPELSELVGQAAFLEAQDASRRSEALALQIVYRSLLSVSEESVRNCSNRLVHRLNGAKSHSVPEAWILKLASHYPNGDVGLFSFFLMNLVSLNPLQAIFIGPNIPHAYLEGELVECMANSDNVVRAGLTEKFRDAPTLLRMLRYEHSGPSFVFPESRAAGTLTYRSPASEFIIDRFFGTLTEKFSSDIGVGILLCVKGDGEIHSRSAPLSFQEGNVVLMPASCLPLELRLREAEVFVARVNIENGGT